MTKINWQTGEGLSEAREQMMADDNQFAPYMYGYIDKQIAQKFALSPSEIAPGGSYALAQTQFQQFKESLGMTDAPHNEIDSYIEEMTPKQQEVIREMVEITKGDRVTRRRPLEYLKEQPTGQVVKVDGRYAWVAWSNHRGGSPRCISLSALKRVER